MLVLSNIHKSYHQKNKQAFKALNGINLELEAGMFGLLGPNGAGKSSLMRTIATLQKPDEGKILLNGENIIENPEAMRRYLGYLPQEFGVYDGVSVEDLLHYIGKLKGLSCSKQRRNQVDHLIEQVNLQDHKYRAVSGFSGGMKQRFGIAQALLGDPKVLIVDEPTAGLDPEERNRFHNLLANVSANKVVLLSTHIVEDVCNLCPEMAVLAQGKIIKTGTPSELMAQVNNNIWKIVTTPDKADALKNKYNVISQRLFAGKLTSHIYAKSQPSEQFQPVPPDLEDAYFTMLMQSNGGNTQPVGERT